MKQQPQPIAVTNSKNCEPYSHGPAKLPAGRNNVGDWTAHGVELLNEHRRYTKSIWGDVSEGKCLQHKYEDLNLEPWHPYRKPKCSSVHL